MSETRTEPPGIEMRATRFSDVCGTIDELKRVLYEEPQTVATRPESLAALADDALSMLRRMEPRLHEYERFRAEVTALATAMQEMGDAPRYDPAAPLLEAMLQRRQVLSEDERAAVVAEAEAIREVAIDLEKRLYRYKDLALALGRARALTILNFVAGVVSLGSAYLLIHQSGVLGAGIAKILAGSIFLILLPIVRNVFTSHVARPLPAGAASALALPSLD